MSRARPYVDPTTGEQLWFDQRAKATPKQLELLADMEGIELDDLLDEGLTQKQVLYRLREIEGVIPEHVLETRRARAALQSKQSVCRICSLNGWKCEGSITRHHFIPRWLMLELENYQSYASRSVCTIPVCVARHRDLHYRNDGTPKSIVPFLRDHERAFARRLMDELREQHPKIFELISSGDETTYEGQLARDYLSGEFHRSDNSYALAEYLENESQQAAL